MTKRTRKTHSPGFKAKVALAAIDGEKPLAELTKLFDVQRGAVSALWARATKRLASWRLALHRLRTALDRLHAGDLAKALGDQVAAGSTRLHTVGDALLLRALLETLAAEDLTLP